jgi:TRAP-type C4-dicarboxylate transport system substrate-binding protein
MKRLALCKNSGIRRLAALACLSAGLMLALPAGAQQITMKIAFSTIRSGMENWANTIKAGLERRAGNRLKIEVYPGGQLGAQPSVIRNAQLGAIEMAEMPPELLTAVDSRFDIFAAPGIFDDLAHAHRALHEKDFVKSFWPILDSKELKLIGFACESESDYIATTPIKTLADFKGKKIRVLGSKQEVEIMRRLGATGVPMEFSEVIPAFQQKAIDGVRVGIVIFVPFKFYTIARNVVRTDE